ncbi:MAG: YkgJ family cysteine cluster protein [Caldilineaceae bacterium]|nr:YkgJ family cysteine cluster protein [Caldilineaceae bacterium]
MGATDLCLSCGACCVHFRVSFHWSEAEPELGGAVPAALTEPLDNFHLVMRGTAARPVRCIALEGEVGSCVRCTIYADRPSPCREFPVAWEAGMPNPRCDQARAACGLRPLTREEVMGPFPVILPSVPQLPVELPAATGGLLLPPAGLAPGDCQPQPPGEPPDASPTSPLPVAA